MKKFVALLALGSVGCGAGAFAVPLPIPIPIPPVPAVLVPLDGQWTLADTAGVRSCLTIQESRVSIVDTSCSNDGLGLAARIREAPLITRSGQIIVLSVTYNPKTGVDTQSTLVFSGQLQVDGTFVGTRHDETVFPMDDKVTIRDQPAILSRW